MCSRVEGPVDCQISIWAWVTCSTAVLCSAASQLQNSIVTVTFCLARWNAESVTGLIDRRRFSRFHRMNRATSFRCSSVVMRC
jgi:hypothetical protein